MFSLLLTVFSLYEKIQIQIKLKVNQPIPNPLNWLKISDVIHSMHMPTVHNLTVSRGLYKKVVLLMDNQKKHIINRKFLIEFSMQLNIFRTFNNQ